MSVVEIEEYIKPLSHAEKLQLIQDIVEMLKAPDETLLRQFRKTAAIRVTRCSGPLEAYEAARQLQHLIEEESV